MRPGRLELLEARMLLNADAPWRPAPPAYEIPPPPAEVGGAPGEPAAEDVEVVTGPPRDAIHEAEGGEGAADGPAEEGAWGPYVAPSPPLLVYPAPPVAYVAVAARAAIWDNMSFVGVDEAGNSQTSFPYRPEVLDTLLTGPGGSYHYSPEESAHPAPDGPEPPPLFGPPTPAEINSLPKLPWAPNYRYDGYFSTEGSTESLRIPLGPSTRTLTISVRPSDLNGGGRPPRVADIFLTNPRGEVLASMTGGGFLAGTSHQKIFLTINGAVLGSSIVVRFTRDDPGTDTDFGGSEHPAPPIVGDPGAPPSASTPAPGFVVDVTRGDASPGSQGLQTFAAPRPEGAVSVVLPVVIYDKVEAPKLVSPTGNSVSTEESETARSSRVADSPRAARADSRDAEPRETTQPAEVYLGPLISRTGAPLGPTLATDADEPTPPSQRSQGVATHAMGADADLDVLRELQFRSGRDGNSDGAPGDSDAASMTSTVRSPAGVPILVASMQASDAREEAQGLVANLQRQARENAMIAAAGLEAAPEPSARKDEAARAGLATRAVGFLIGMGLATGPLYPDLVSYARRKFLHKRKRRVYRKGGPGRTG